MLSASSSTKTTARPRERRRSISRRSRLGSTGVMRIPATRCSSRKRRWRCCRWGDPSELHSTTEYPRRSSAASAPRATSVKNGLPASRTTSPTILLWVDRRRDADPLRIYPSSSMADSTAARVASETVSGRLRTFDTVPTETPARAATSRISADFRVICCHQRQRCCRARRRRTCWHANVHAASDAISSNGVWRLGRTGSSTAARQVPIRLCVPGPSCVVGHPSTSTVADAPSGTVTSTSRVVPLRRHETDASPNVVAILAEAEVSPPPGRGRMRIVRYPGSAGASPATTRCRKSATAPNA